MSDYRAQSRTGSIDGSSVVPIICNNNNFAKGSEVSGVQYCVLCSYVGLIAFVRLHILFKAPL